MFYLNFAGDVDDFHVRRVAVNIVAKVDEQIRLLGDHGVENRLVVVLVAAGAKSYFRNDAFDLAGVANDWAVLGEAGALNQQQYQNQTGEVKSNRASLWQHLNSRLFFF